MLNCPLGYYSNFDRTNCLKCMQGCLQCSTNDKCELCADSSSPDGIAYTLNAEGKCQLLCQSTEGSSEEQTFTPYEGCPEEVCSVTGNCDKCFGPNDNNCHQCTAAYLLEGSSCVSECTTGYYEWFGKCEKCPQ